MKDRCLHVDPETGKEDCENDAEVVCTCCNFPICYEHMPHNNRCYFGGGNFEEIE